MPENEPPAAKPAGRAATRRPRTTKAKAAVSAPAAKRGAAAASKAAPKPAAAKRAAKTVPQPEPVHRPGPDAGATAPAGSPPRRIGGGWLAVGVGSAAIVAALLFATRGKRNDWSK